MVSVKQLDKKQVEFISNLSSNELKKYIKNLTKEYYISLSNKDNDKVVTIFDNLKRVIQLHGDDIENYINYSLAKEFNEILFKSVNHDSNIGPLEIKEPKYISDIGTGRGIFHESHLEKILRAFQYSKAHEYCDELEKKLLTDEDIKNYFNFKDYEH